MNGTEIRNARERAGLTQEELGERVGVSGRTVGNWERGKSVPRNRLAKLQVVLNVEDTNAEQNPLREVSDATLLAEIARRFDAGRLREEEGDGDAEATPPIQAAGSAADQTVVDFRPPPALDTAAYHGPNRGKEFRERQDADAEGSQDPEDHK